MTRMQLVRRGLWIAIVLVVLAGLARRFLFAEPGPTVRLRETARSLGAAERERVRSSPSPHASESTPCSVEVHVEVVPAGSELAWAADLYLGPTPSRERKRLASEDRRGPGAVIWDVSHDVYAVHVRSAGAFGSVWSDLRPSPSQPTVVSVTLHAPARVSGRVTDAAGAPLGGARVLLAPVRAPPGLRQAPYELMAAEASRSEERSAVTDSEGRYELADLDPRLTYHAAAACPGHAVTRELGLTLESGGERVLDFALPPGCRLTGRVADVDGRPIGGLGLRIAAPTNDTPDLLEWRPEGGSRTDGEGRFVFDSLRPGRKRIDALVENEPGRAVVGSWECHPQRGDDLDLGELRLRSSCFELLLEAPEGPLPLVSVSFALTPDLPASDRDTTDAAIFVPVAVDERGSLRVHGLPAGAVYAVVREAAARADGRWRPPSRFEERFDGSAASVCWTLEPLQDEEPAAVDAEGRCIFDVGVEVDDAAPSAVALLWLNGRLAGVRPAAGGGVGVAVVPGDRVRLVLTDGERWGETETLVEDATSRLVVPERIDRPGRRLTVVAVDGGRPVPGAIVFVGPAGNDDAGLAPYATTGDDGRVVLGGLPRDLGLAVTAGMFGRRAPPVTVEWHGDEATVEIDVGDR